MPHPTSPRITMSASTQRRNQRASLASISGKFCFYCGHAGELTLDHIIPKSRGGAGDRSNLVLACWDCNQDKMDITLEEYRESLGQQQFVDMLQFGVAASDYPFWGEVNTPLAYRPQTFKTKVYRTIAVWKGNPVKVPKMYQARAM